MFERKLSSGEKQIKNKKSGRRQIDRDYCTERKRKGKSEEDKFAELQTDRQTDRIDHIRVKPISGERERRKRRGTNRLLPR